MEETPAGPANYAIDCDATTMTVVDDTRRTMMGVRNGGHAGAGAGAFDWPLDAPLKIKVRAQEIEWPDVWRLPDREVPRDPNRQRELTLVPYGCTKLFRVSMFPIVAPAEA